MSARYEWSEANITEVEFKRASEIDGNLHGSAIVIGDPDATAFVVRGTVADLVQFATAVTRAATIAALHAEGKYR